jgi:serine/threonine-protein kinase
MRTSATPPPAPAVRPPSMPPPKPLNYSGAAPEPVEDRGSSNGTLTNAAVATGNPFLAPVQAPEDGGPPSLLPPPPAAIAAPSVPPSPARAPAAPPPPTVPPLPANLKSPSALPSVPSVPPKRTTPPPPPGLLRTVPPSARSLPPPPSRVSSSMAPLPALAGTVPPVRDGKALDREIAKIHGRARRKRFATFAAIAGVVVAGYYVRDKLGGTGGTTAAATQEPAAIRVTAKREGIKLVLDGKELGSLPQEVKGLAPGEHAVVFEGGDRYAPQKTTITLTPNETKDLEFVSLKVKTGAATFDVKTPGTILTLVSADERRALTDYSHPIDIDTSKSWTLEAVKSGFRTLTMPINFDDVAEKTFVVALTEPMKSDMKAEAVAAQDTSSDEGKGSSKSSGPTQVAAVTPKPAAAPAPAPAKEKEKEKEKEAAPAPAAKPAAGNCTLNINSIPTSKITLDGRPIGLTPKMGVSVPAGPHSVMLISDNGRKATNATCKAGETKTIAVRISQ